MGNHKSGSAESNYDDDKEGENGVVDDEEEEDGYDNSDNNGVRTVVMPRSWRKRRRRRMGLMTLELQKAQHLAHKPAPLVSADHSQAPPSSLAHS